MDASDTAVGAILSQLCEDEWCHPEAFDSWPFVPAEVKYDVYDKQVTARVAAFWQSKYMLRSVEAQLMVYTYHKNLEYFNSTKILHRGQQNWAEFLQSLNFKVVYREGRLNENADTLSKRRDNHPQWGSNSDHPSFFCRHQYVRQEQDILWAQVLQSC